jgi:hypothetical protein
MCTVFYLLAEVWYVSKIGSKHSGAKMHWKTYSA